MLRTVSRIDWYRAVFLFLLSLHIFLRLYDLNGRMQFTWDQVKNAWVMKDMIVDHRFPLVGMVAKLNTGFYIGPAYYYLLAPFYYLFGLEPTAGGVFAATVSAISFFILFWVTKRLFSSTVALIACAILTVSSFMIGFDRIPWPVLFIPMVSLTIFYSLYRVLMGNVKYLLLLALATGFSFHIHFTSVMYVIIFFCTLPLLIFLPKFFYYEILGLGLFSLWFIPSILAGMFSKVSSTVHIVNYIHTYYHGFHLVRVLQVANDAFISFEPILFFKIAKYLKYVIPLGFVYRLVFIEKRYLLAYLIFLWLTVPLVTFSLYSGEISDYYFSLTIPIVLISLAYFIDYFWRLHTVARVVILLLSLLYIVTNLHDFFFHSYSNLPATRETVSKAIREGRVISFTEGDPASYLYSLYLLRQQKRK